MMKTSEEIKKIMANPRDYIFDLYAFMRASLAYINQLESTYSQVSKALCGKENATPEEILQALDQLKTRICQAELERDALMHDVSKCRRCETCAKRRIPIHKCPHFDGGTQYPCWQWRGVCPENTKEDDE